MKLLLFDQNISPRLVERIESMLRENRSAIRALSDDPETGILTLF